MRSRTSRRRKWKRSSGRLFQLTSELRVHCLHERKRRGEQNDRRVGAVLGLDEQVEGLHAANGTARIDPSMVAAMAAPEPYADPASVRP